MSERKSYREILRSSSIIGGASIANVLIGIARTKAVAIILGPAGIGLIGLLQNLVVTASTVSALGFGKVGTRQIADAAANGDEEDVWVARRALFWGTLVLAGIGALIFWSLRHVLAQKVLGDPELGYQVGWLSLAVALSVASGSQVALLNGLRRISDIALVNIVSAVMEPNFEPNFAEISINLNTCLSRARKLGLV